MSDTKAVNLTEDEIIYVIAQRGYQLTDKETDNDMVLERLNYLNKRLKAFKEPEAKTEATLNTSPSTGAWPTNG